MSVRRSAPLLLALAALAPLSFVGAEQKPINFNRDIRPILSNNCYFCHGPDEHERKADLRLDTYEGAIEDRDGSLAIDPENLADSEFIHRITSTDPDDIMPTPKSHKKLSSDQIDLLTRWVESGAEYAEHWSFVAPPAKPEVPRNGAGWGSNPIDAFVLSRMKEIGTSPSAEARPENLIRRLSLDLCGLPPTPQETADFLKAHSSDPEKAYGELADRLLASEHFGERMALAWMDAARYGDSSVMHADGPREMWSWRDWVINAYNANKSFSDFLREQLAGDLLPDATFDQKVASGFNRNNATSDEGGAFAEELRVDYIVDRVQTTSNVFLGLSMECAQCHDHKYDPISQKEYFNFFAFFNNNADPGMQTRKGNQAPLVKFTVGGDQDKAAEIDTLVAEVDKSIAQRRKAAQGDLQTWLASATPENVLMPEPDGLAWHLPLDDPSELPLPEDTTLLTFPTKDDRTFFNVHGSNAHHIKLGGEDTPDLDMAQPFTVAFSMRTVEGTGSSAILSRMGANYRGWDVWVEGGSRPGVHLIDTWPGNALKVFAKNPLKENAWTHVAIAYDGSRKAKGIKIYYDGKEVPVQIATDTLKPKSSNLLPKDTHPINVASRDGRKSPFTGSFDDIRIYSHRLNGAQVASLDTAPLRAALIATVEERKPEQAKLLNEHFFAHVDGPQQKLAAQKSALLAERAKAMKGAIDYSSMIMGDLPMDKMRKTYVLDRGDYDSPKEDEVIPPGVPAFLPPMPDGAPANRLGLADWLLRDDHPLTARVTLNRYWAMLFGRGLSPSVMDFGNQGQAPSHPALLDWMARDFIDSGWDIKHALRQIVTSATYRQSSAADADALEIDPENLLWARGPRFRLQGEFIRDLALSTAGLLKQEVGGPGTKPYQPEGLWNEVSLNKGVRFVQDSGDKLYRKSMYIYWKRSSPHPSMSIFDAPSREKCVVQRDRTNTPLQALVTLNDVQFVEASRRLASRMVKEGGDDLDSQIGQAYLLCLSRQPTAQELAVCREVYDTQLASFTEEPARADAYLAHGDSPRADAIPPLEHAALTVLANMILNLDETLTRG